MTFQIPFQILRAATATQPIRLLRTSILRTAIDPKRLLNSLTPQTRKISRKASYKIVSLPVKLRPSRAFSEYRNITSNEANRRKVRKMHKCDEKEEEEMEVLKFRKDCKPCRKHKPTQCPKLGRPKKLYDPNEMKYNHRECVQRDESKPDRMDDIQGYRIKPKKLPPLPELDDCFPCQKHRPKTAPKLVRPKQMYDPYKQKRNDKCISEETNSCPPRMDDVLGWTVKQKSLPQIPTSDCEPCRKFKPLTAPKLVPPQKLYDEEKLKYNHKVKQREEVKLAPRMDDVVGLQIKQKTLPALIEVNDCIPCQKHRPKHTPKLRSPKPRYDQSQMKYRHLEPKTEEPCTSFRMDNVVGLRVTRKVLPNIKFDDCKNCQGQKPCSAPILRRLKKLYDPSELEYKHADCPEIEVEKALRMDEVTGLKITPKKLPPMPTSDCKPCLNYIANKLPKLKPPQKLFDDSKMEYKRPECPIEPDLKPPERMDDVVGYKIEKKQFPKLSLINDCVPCQKYRPQTAPKLRKPVKLYNDSEMLYGHVYPKEDIQSCPERMDDVMGFEIKSKTLPKMFDNTSCEPCQKHRPSVAPELCGPTQLYDPTLLDRKDKICPTIDIKCAPRMDEIVGCIVKKKSLPILTNDNCKPCRKNYPTKAPKLVRLKKKYEPTDMPHPSIAEDECDLNPPRMDDVLCWKPKKKKLPSILQKCGYCTLSSKHKVGNERLIYNTYAKVGYSTKVQQNVQLQSNRFYSKKSLCGPRNNTKKKQKKNCPKFKISQCRTGPPKTPPQCKKVEAPYECFNENFKGFRERNLTECPPYHLQILQPKNISSSVPLVLKPPPPRFAHVDPEKAIKCHVEKECVGLEDEYKEPKKKYKNPCGSACKEKTCKPRLRNDCYEVSADSASKQKVEAPYESFSDHCPQFPPIEYSECNAAEKIDLTKFIHINEELRRRQEKAACKKKAVVYKTDQKCDYSSGGPKPVSEKKSKKTSGKGTSKKGSKTSNSTECKKQNTGLLKTKNKPGRSSSRKASDVSIKTAKIITRSKSTSKCDPRQSKHTNEFCCNVNKQDINKCCIPNKDLMEICKKRHPQSIWEKICAYFRARPNCPTPEDYKRKRLLEKAEIAAKAAGMELCPAKKKAGCDNMFYARTVKPKNSCKCPSPKRKTTVCSKTTYNFPPVKRKTTVCSKKTSASSCSKSQYHSDCKISKPKTKTRGYFANRLGQKITTNTQINKNIRQFSTYSNILTRNPKFKNNRKPVLQNHPIFDTDSKLASCVNNKRSQKKICKSSSLTDNYVGKIYRLKFTKIGVKNALITQKDKDAAHTVCYICKIVNKNNSVYPKNDPNIKNIKIRSNPERRTAF